MAADALTPHVATLSAAMLLLAHCVARLSTAMMSTVSDKLVLVFYEEDVKYLHYINAENLIKCKHIFSNCLHYHITKKIKKMFFYEKFKNVYIFEI